MCYITIDKAIRFEQKTSTDIYRSFLVMLLNSSKFGGLRALPARLLNKLEYIGSPLPIVGDDAVEVGAKFDGPFGGVI